MNKEVIKDIIALKLKIIDAFTDELPQTIREEVKNLQIDLAEAMKEAIREYLERNNEANNTNEIKSVSIE